MIDLVMPLEQAPLIDEAALISGMERWISGGALGANAGFYQAAGILSLAPYGSLITQVGMSHSDAVSGHAFDLVLGRGLDQATLTANAPTTRRDVPSTATAGGIPASSQLWVNGRSAAPNGTIIATIVVPVGTFVSLDLPLILNKNDELGFFCQDQNVSFRPFFQGIDFAAQDNRDFIVARML